MEGRSFRRPQRPSTYHLEHWAGDRQPAKGGVINHLRPTPAPRQPTMPHLPQPAMEGKAQPPPIILIQCGEVYIITCYRVNVERRCWFSLWNGRSSTHCVVSEGTRKRGPKIDG